MYTNPVIDDNFPDPAIIRTRSGWYYAYGTQTKRAGVVINLQVARSADLINWEYLGEGLPEKPSWATESQKIWAPHVSEHHGRFYLYYSARPNGADHFSLAVAVADAPAGPFLDSGQPLLAGPGFTCIDPMAFDDPATGQRLLYWGSGFGPIWVQELADDRLGFRAGSAPQALIHPSTSHDPRDYTGWWKRPGCTSVRAGTTFSFRATTAVGPRLTTRCSWLGPATPPAPSRRMPLPRATRTRPC
ncbi:hypothetical protein BEN47_01220 [Hymenobacter lapidarius]|uniref:Glycoside hydrolase n=1 Tax=Hymenobacter lapidarius TaxID=1908237 RepID=A0A1G1T5Q4_9BACT|nr:hypothetical protein BEN47_01220 [Hymenobacter lapidarius]